MPKLNQFLASLFWMNKYKMYRNKSLPKTYLKVANHKEV